jgi:hypothetical protein
MGITTERRLLRIIHKQAYIERECSSCLHNGDYTVCAFCGHDRQRFEWRFENEFRIAQVTAEDIYTQRPKKGARK